MESCCAGARWFAVASLSVSLIAVGGGCTESGQTGSPADVPPTYDSFTNFGSDSGGVIDMDGSGPCYDSNSPLWSRSPNDLVEVVGNHLVMAVDQERLPSRYGVPQPVLARGLLVFDVSTPDQPQLVGELPLDGQPLALELEDNVATVVMQQTNAVDFDQLPTERVPYENTRLIRVDFSDPATPTRVADVALPGDFWSLQIIGGRHYVLSSQWEPAEPVCVQAGLLIDDMVESCPVGSLQVSVYSFDGTSFVQDAHQDIGGDGYTGFVGDGSFVAVSGTGELEQTLSAAWVDGEDGSLQVSGTASVDGMVPSASLSDGLLAALVAPATGTGEVRLYDVADGQAPTELGAVAVPGTPARMAFQPGGGALLLEGASQVEPGPAYLVDLTDPTAPTLTPLEGTLEAAWMGSSVLGLAVDTGHVVASLWDATDPSAPAQIDQVETNVPYTWGDYWRAPYWTAQASTGQFLYPSGVLDDGGDWMPQLLAVQAEAGALTVVAEPHIATRSHRPVIHAQTAYSVSDGVLEAIPLTPASVPQTTDLYPDRDRYVLSEKSVGSRVARLVREGEDLLVEIESDGAEPTRFVLEHFAEELYVDGNRVVALGLRRNWDCDLLAEMPDNPDLILTCPTPNQAGITVISAEDDPRVEASILISSDLDAPDLPADADCVSQWYGYVSLGEGRLLLPVSRAIRCESSAACEELGIQAYEALATPECEGGDADCSDQPSVIVTNSGSEWQKWIYVLDLAADDGPALLPGMRLQEDAAGGYDRFDLSGEEGPLDLSVDVLASGSVLGFPSLEHLYDQSGNSISNEHGDNLVRNWIHLVSVGPDVPVEWVGSVNIPGRALALRDRGSTVFSVAPEYANDTTIRAVLQRSEIREGGAYLDETLSLGVGYRDGIAIGGRGYFIRGPEDPCAEDATTAVFSVALGGGDLSVDPALDIPGANWSFARFDWPWDEGTLLLRGGPADYRGRLSLDVSDRDSAPAIIRYHSEAQ